MEKETSKDKEYVLEGVLQEFEKENKNPTTYLNEEALAEAMSPSKVTYTNPFTQPVQQGRDLVAYRKKRKRKHQLVKASRRANRKTK